MQKRPLVTTSMKQLFGIRYLIFEFYPQSSCHLQSHFAKLHSSVTPEDYTTRSSKRGKVVTGEKALIKAMSCPLLINLMASAGPLSLRTTLVKLKEYIPEVEVVVYVGKQIWWDEASREYTSRERCFRVVRIPRIQSDFL